MSPHRPLKLSDDAGSSRRPARFVDKTADESSGSMNAFSMEMIHMKSGLMSWGWAGVGMFANSAHLPTARNCATMNKFRDRLPHLHANVVMRALVLAVAQLGAYALAS